MANLSDKQNAFITHYVTHWNATRAAIQAGYSERTAYSIGYENLRKPEISAEIERRKAEFMMGAHEVMARLTQQARGDLAPFLYDDDNPMRGEAPAIDLNTDQARQHIGLVKKLKTKTRTIIGEERSFEDIEVEITLHDAQAALDKLARIHGLYQDDVKIAEAVENERAAIFSKLKEKLSADDYQRALEALQAA